jgi:type IV pilus assembly protein PilX
MNRVPARRAQRGVILFIALIILVAMSLAGIALMRTVDTNVLIAGNLGFRQANTMYGDVGVEAARTWLTSNMASLNNNQPGGGTHYWANYQLGLDFIQGTSSTTDDYDWSNAASATSPDPAFTIRYVIHRLCGGTGAPSDASAKCMQASAGGGGGSSGLGTKGIVTYGGQALPGVSTIFYRVTVRVTGPRNTLSYVQAILN